MQQLEGKGNSCSASCRGESQVRDYELLDAGRLRLSCGHFSRHLPCIVFEVYQGPFGSFDICPIRDTLKCNWHPKEEERGKHHFWGNQNYHNFIKAFLRSEVLVKAFIKPQFLSPED